MIEFNNAEHGHLIAKHAGSIFNPVADTVISRVERGEFRGGVIYNNYTGASINLHVYGVYPDWVNRDMLWICFHYPFVQLGCKKVFAQVPANNTRSLDFELKLGFKIEARIADVFPDEDLIVVSMRREDCRWLKIRPNGVICNQEPT